MRIISSQSFFLYAARPTVISTVDSGAEKSPAPMAPVPPPPHCHFDRNGAKRSGVEWSGVEWRNLQPQWHSPIAVGDLSTQSINGVQMPLSSYRHAAPLEMTCWQAAHSHGEQKQMTQIPHPPTCHFDWNGAKQSGVEKSPVSMVPVPPPPTVISTGTEQSGVEWRNLRPQRHRPHCGGRSRGSEPQWSSNTLTFLPIRSPARDDRAASHHFGKFQSIEAKKKEL